VFVHDVPRIFEYDRDPKDEAYINLALAAGATYLVSRQRPIGSCQSIESLGIRCWLGPREQTWRARRLSELPIYSLSITSFDSRPLNLKLWRARNCEEMLLTGFF
jgi:hypothetical protein